MESTITPFSLVPNEVTYQILYGLPLKDTVTAMFVCKEWKHILEADAIWRPFLNLLKRNPGTLVEAASEKNVTIGPVLRELNNKNCLKAFQASRKSLLMGAMFLQENPSENSSLETELSARDSLAREALSLRKELMKFEEAKKNKTMQFPDNAFLAHVVLSRLGISSLQEAYKIAEAKFKERNYIKFVNLYEPLILEYAEQGHFSQVKKLLLEEFNIELKQYFYRRVLLSIIGIYIKNGNFNDALSLMEDYHDKDDSHKKSQEFVEARAFLFSYLNEIKYDQDVIMALRKRLE